MESKGSGLRDDPGVAKVEGAENTRPITGGNRICLKKAEN
jgi:hypothetical protein